MARRGIKRKVLDEWFPTLARYVGLMLVPYIVFVDRGKNAALIPFAGALIFYKNARDAFKANGGGNEK